MLVFPITVHPHSLQTYTKNNGLRIPLATLQKRVEKKLEDNQKEFFIFLFYF
jgi:hypothetical protein